MIRRPRTLAALAAFVLLAPALLSAQSQQEFGARRAALLAGLPDGALIALGAHEPPQDYLTFVQSPSFYYLTGFKEPDAALVVVKQGGHVTSSTMFVQPRLPSREVWTGARLGVEGIGRLTGMQGRSVADLAKVLDSLAGAGARLSVVGDFGTAAAGPPLLATRSPDEQIFDHLKAAHAGLQVIPVNEAVEALRGKKSPAEQAFIRQAVDITVMAQREAMAAIEPSMNEFEIQALIEYTFRRNGADRPSFSTIVGSGPNSTTLHYSLDDRSIQPGDVIVMDIGASYKGYAADVTRTVPASGTFSPEQRAVYGIVRAAQAAAERQAKLGASARLMTDSSSAVLAAGLARLGLIESPTATYDCVANDPSRKCPQYRLYYMHGLGHGIGLEVHDPDQYYRTGVIAPGSAFTIEPGIYVREHVLEEMPDSPRNREIAATLRGAVQRYRDIGVRIEDDYLATEQGVEWISRAPREIDEVEAAMRGSYAGPAKRDAGLVERYGRP
ncbi:MAG TPA: aminopeptidase P N-terminal domain-containing protein [Gemmatimonadaceae bacterium]|jgi:Xaa-Pro aminopeptidase|nr:aminopeptidase P N-terminal domain-containing protein [Gemmatimonadaceae bacterium]